VPVSILGFSYLSRFLGVGVVLPFLVVNSYGHERGPPSMYMVFLIVHTRAAVSEIDMVNGWPCSGCYGLCCPFGGRRVSVEKSVVTVRPLMCFKLRLVRFGNLMLINGPHWLSQLSARDARQTPPRK